MMVLIVFFAGYSVLPKKYNPLPMADAICATNYGGVYRPKETFEFVYKITYTNKNGVKTTTYYSKVYYKNKTYTVTDWGYDSNNKSICLVNVLSSKFYRLYK